MSSSATRWRVSFWSAIVMLAFSFSVHAAGTVVGEGNNLKRLIKKHQGTPAVVSPLGASPKGKYGLLVFTPEGFAKAVELEKPDRLENSHFKVIQDDGSEALPVCDFDGDNVLYHLTRAREYFAKLSDDSGIPNPAVDGKIVVRVRVDEAYNLVTHFSKKEDFNNSRYIPSNYAGNWGGEIWFDRRKRRLENMNWYDLTMVAGQAVSTRNWVSLAIIPPFQLLMHYNAGLDAAKIPDVIYHEAFHYATDSDRLFPMTSEGQPIAEDYANYFGTSLNGKPQIAEINEFSGSYYRRKYEKIKNVKSTTPMDYNSTTFVPSVFWQIRNLLGQERADQLIWNSMLPLNGSFKHTDIPRSVSIAAHEDPALTMDEVEQIDELLRLHQQDFENLEKKFNPDEPAAKPSPGSGDSVTPAPGATNPPPAGSPPKNKQGAVLRLARRVWNGLKKVGEVIEDGLIKTAEGMGYLGSIAYSISNVPLTFGTDLVTSLIQGTGMITDNKADWPSQVMGGVGGVGAMYGSYQFLTSQALGVVSPVAMAGMGVSLANSLACMKSDPRGKSELDRYCGHTNTITGTVTKASAKAGAVLGGAIHKMFRWMIK